MTAICLSTLHLKGKLRGGGSLLRDVRFPEMAGTEIPPNQWQSAAAPQPSIIHNSVVEKLITIIRINAGGVPSGAGSTSGAQLTPVR
jgi:hypothetical protein